MMNGSKALENVFTLIAVAAWHLGVCVLTPESKSVQGFK